MAPAPPGDHRFRNRGRHACACRDKKPHVLPILVLIRSIFIHPNVALDRHAIGMLRMALLRSEVLIRAWVRWDMTFMTALGPNYGTSQPAEELALAWL